VKKSYLIVALTLVCLFGFRISAGAQDTEGIRVKVPFEFIAGGATLPAGTYSIGRLSVDQRSAISIRGWGNTAFVLPMAVNEAAGEQSKLSFDHVGDKYLLSEIETPGGSYTLALPQAMVALAQMKDHSTVSSASGN
jgi:hypothetical protein